MENEIKDLEFAMLACRLLGLGVLHVRIANGVYRYEIKKPTYTHQFRTIGRLVKYCLNAIEAAPKVMAGNDVVRSSYANSKVRHAQACGRRSVTFVSCMN